MSQKDDKQRLSVSRKWPFGSLLIWFWSLESCAPLHYRTTIKQLQEH